jgi:hypothetical protein
MTTRDDELRIRPGRIQHGNKGAKPPKSFVGEVMRAAKKAGHIGNSFRSAPLRKHIAYLKREGVAREGENARMFEAATDTADEHAFAKRCKDDRHHSPCRRRTRRKWRTCIFSRESS